MKAVAFIILLAALVCASMMSCSNDNGVRSDAVETDQSLTAVTGPATEFTPYALQRRCTVGQFPNTVGSYWVYGVTDTISGAETEITVSITDIVTLSGGVQAAEWVYTEGSSTIKTEWVNITADTVSFYRTDDANEDPYRYRELIFPIQWGNTWNFWLGLHAEYCSVPAMPVITVPAGTFGTFQTHIRHSSGMLDMVDLSDLYLSPNNGFVRIDRTRGWRQTIHSHEIWELEEYSIAK